MIKITCLSKTKEDCFIIEIGEADNKICILLDGGNDYEILKDYYEKTFDYIVVTHIDQDHIKGVLDLYKQNKSCISNAKLIYNCVTNWSEISYNHAVQLEKIISFNKLITTYRNNFKNFSDNRIMFLSYENRVDNNFDYDYILNVNTNDTILITFLNPTIEMVKNVYNDYLKKSKNASIDINSSSIAFLLEYKDKTLLFTGDCYIKDIKTKVCDIFTKKNNKIIDFIKISHHGAYDSNKGIVDMINDYQCKSIYITNSNTDKHPSKKLLEEFDKINNNLDIYTNNDANSNYKQISNKKINILLRDNRNSIMI